MKKSMLSDDGVDFLSARLAVVLMAAALLLAMAAVYVNGYVEGTAKEMARQEARRIISLARAEYASGCPGTGCKAYISVSIPGCVKLMSFGDKACSIEFVDGSLETYWCGCQVLPVALYPGDYKLELEVVEDNGAFCIALRGL